MKTNSDANGIVLSYIKALGNEDYGAASRYLSESVRIMGPTGESFSKSEEFINMLRQNRGRYDLKKTFTDGDDVCLIYDLVTPAVTVFMCSWYHVIDGKIASIQTVFDTQAFNSPQNKKND